MMISLKGVTVEKEGNRILRNVTIHVPKGSFFVLMGPTGCGKTTTLRIAGLLERPGGGEVLFEGRKVPHGGRDLLRTRRRIATVFQSPVMFRGSVRGNLEWGLSIRGLGKRETEARVLESAALTGLEDFLDRDAGKLSGGEMRRVALARALALRPELLILDEPTTSLHPSFRKEFLERLKELHRDTGTTFLAATHEFSDALAAGTCGAVMRRGEIVQEGSISDILHSPASRFMADFTGTGNILPAMLSPGIARVGELEIRHTSAGSGSGFIAVPPEVIAISLERGQGSERNRFPAVVVSMVQHGLTWTVKVRSGGVDLDVALTEGALSELELHPGSKVFLSFKASAVHVF